MKPSCVEEARRLLTFCRDVFQTTLEAEDGDAVTLMVDLDQMVQRMDLFLQVTACEDCAEVDGYVRSGGFFDEEDYEVSDAEEFNRSIDEFLRRLRERGLD